MMAASPIERGQAAAGRETGRPSAARDMIMKLNAALSSQDSGLYDCSLVSEHAFNRLRHAGQTLLETRNILGLLSRQTHGPTPCGYKFESEREN